MLKKSWMSERLRITATLLAVLMITGCSNRGMYENLQINMRQECAKRPPSQYEDCMESVNKSYDEYEREREDILEEP